MPKNEAKWLLKKAVVLAVVVGGVVLAMSAPASADGGRKASKAAVKTKADPVTAGIDGDLAKLRELEIFDSASLVMDLPAEANSCYGLCPEWKEKAAEEKVRQAPRLERLTEIAWEVRAKKDLPPGDTAQVAGDLEALASLKIVAVGALVTKVPESEARCYNTPCGESVVAANAENQRRAAELHALVAQAEREKI